MAQLTIASKPNAIQENRARVDAIQMEPNSTDLVKTQPNRARADPIQMEPNGTDLVKTQPKPTGMMVCRMRSPTISSFVVVHSLQGPFSLANPRRFSPIWVGGG